MKVNHEEILQDGEMLVNPEDEGTVLYSIPDDRFALDFRPVRKAIEEISVKINTYHMRIALRLRSMPSGCLNMDWEDIFRQYGTFSDLKAYFENLGEHGSFIFSEVLFPTLSRSSVYSL